MGSKGEVRVADTDDVFLCVFATGLISFTICDLLKLLLQSMVINAKFQM